jgi:hypothetical protein
MLGFFPISAKPLSDDGFVVSGAFQPRNIVMGAPVVDTAPVFEDETIPAAEITSGSPTIDNVVVAVTSNFSANNITVTPVVDTATTQFTDVLAADEITTGAPTFDDVTASIISNFDADEITLGAPTVDTATVAVISNFFPVSLEPQPVVDALPFFQEYALTMVEITAGIPTLPARFTWDYQEPVADSWTEQADDDSVWTTQSASSDTWTEATEPTDTWTEVNYQHRAGRYCFRDKQ